MVMVVGMGIWGWHTYSVLQITTGSCTGNRSGTGTGAGTGIQTCLGTETGTLD